METESEEYDIFDLIIADSLLETHSWCFWERVNLSVFRSIYGPVIKSRLKLIENKHYKGYSHLRTNTIAFFTITEDTKLISISLKFWRTYLILVVPLLVPTVLEFW